MNLMDLYINLQVEAAGIQMAFNQIKKQTAEFAEQTQKKLTTFTNNIDKTGKNISNLGDSIKTIGTGITAVTGTMTAVVAASYTKATSFIKTYESAMTVFKRKLEGGEEAANQLYNGLVNIAKGSSFAQEYLVSAGQTLVAMGLNANTTKKYIQAATDAIAGMGGSGEELEAMAELFAKISQQTNLYTQDVNQMVTAGIPAWDILAEAYGTTTDKVKEMAKDGLLPATKSLDIITSALEETDKASNMYKYSVQGLAKELKEGTLTGSLDGLNTSFRTFALRLLDLDPRTESGKENIEKLNKAISSFGTVMETFGGTFGSVGTKIITKLEKITSWLDNFNKTLEKMPQPVADAIVKTLTVLAGLGPSLIITGLALKTIGKSISGWSSLLVTLGKLNKWLMTTNTYTAIKTALTWAQTAAELALNSALLANPLTWIILAIVAAIAALVGAFVLLWNNCEGFRNFFINLWNDIKNAFVNTWNAITEWFSKLPENLSKLWDSISNWFNDLIKNIGTWLVNTWNAVSKWFSELPSKMGDWLSTIWNGIVTWFSDLPSNIGYFLGYVLGTIINWYITVYSYLFEKIYQLIEMVVKFFSELPSKIWNWVTETYNKIKDWVVNTWNYLSEKIPELIAAVVKFFSELPDKIWNWLVDVFNKITNWYITVYNYLSEKIYQLIEMVVKFFSELPSKIWNWVTETYNKIKDWVVNTWNYLSEKIPELIRDVVKWFSELPQKIVEIGKNIVEGLWNGIKGATNWLGDKIKEFCGGFMSGFKDALGIKSPSRVMRDQVGKWLPLGIKEGWDNEIEDLESSMIKDMEEITNGLSTTEIPYNVSYNGKANAGLVNGLMSIFQTGDNDTTINLVVNDDVLASVIYDPLSKLVQQKGVAIGA